jgi:hypothetical protein
MSVFCKTTMVSTRHICNQNTIKINRYAIQHIIADMRANYTFMQMTTLLLLERGYEEETQLLK